MLLTEIQSPVSTVEGLKWGQYVGSPALGAPAVGFTQTLNTAVQSLVCLNNDNVFALSHNSTLLTVHQARPGESEERLMWSAALSWGYMDGCIRVCTSPDSAPVCLMEHHTPDKVRCVYVFKRCLLIKSTLPKSVPWLSWNLKWKLTPQADRKKNGSKKT